MPVLSALRLDLKIWRLGYVGGRNEEDSECQFRRHSSRIWRYGDWGMFGGEMTRTANASSISTQVEFGDMEIEVCFGEK